MPLSETANPGLTRAEIIAAWEPYGLTPPEEAIVAWEWHDGYRPGLTGNPGMYQLSLRASLHRYGLGPFGDGRYSWNPDWVPIWMPGPANYSMSFSDPGDRPPLIRATDGGLGTHVDDVASQAVSLCLMVTRWLVQIDHGWLRPEYVEGHLAWQSDWQALPLDWRQSHLAEY